MDHNIFNPTFRSECPGFVDGRDAILQADQILYGGVHECLIWEAFAARGCGFSANQGDPDIAVVKFSSLW